ncbi:MAG: hypothetical protein K2M88_05200, partial [Muribaculaceae bacterium]|nr:hypothetical protein [Muribaculaceae bacterium]
RIVLWCNGSTTVFGSVCPGSNPGKTTLKLLQFPIPRILKEFFSFPTRIPPAKVGSELPQKPVAKRCREGLCPDPAPAATQSKKVLKFIFHLNHSFLIPS